MKLKNNVIKYNLSYEKIFVDLKMHEPKLLSGTLHAVFYLSRLCGNWVQRYEREEI